MTSMWKLAEDYYKITMRKMDIMEEDIGNLRKDLMTLKMNQMEIVELKNTMLSNLKNL